jgi:hypothetical protein
MQDPELTVRVDVLARTYGSLQTGALMGVGPAREIRQSPDNTGRSHYLEPSGRCIGGYWSAGKEEEDRAPRPSLVGRRAAPAVLAGG